MDLLLSLRLIGEEIRDRVLKMGARNGFHSNWLSVAFLVVFWRVYEFGGTRNWKKMRMNFFWGIEN